MKTLSMVKFALVTVLKLASSLILFATLETGIFEGLPSIFLHRCDIIYIILKQSDSQFVKLVIIDKSYSSSDSSNVGSEKKYN